MVNVRVRIEKHGASHEEIKELLDALKKLLSHYNINGYFEMGGEI